VDHFRNAHTKKRSLEVFRQKSDFENCKKKQTKIGTFKKNWMTIHRTELTHYRPAMLSGNRKK